MEQTINEISYLQGAYESFLVSNNKLISLIRVEGINLDLEDDNSQTLIFDSYESFLLAVTSKEDSIMNISMTVKINMSNYVLYWKRKFLETEKMDLDKYAKKNRLNYIASKIIEYEEHASQYEMSTKKHFIVVMQKISQQTQQGLEDAEDMLIQKRTSIIDSFKDAMNSANKQMEMEILEAEDIIEILKLSFDNKTVMYL